MCCNRNGLCLALSIISIIGIIVIALILPLISTTASLGGIQANLTGSGGELLLADELVIFDNVINNQSSDISYDSTTGEFTISKPGNYYISWQVTTDGSELTTDLNFSINVNGVPYSMVSTPIVTGEVSGSALVTIGAPSTISLVNSSEQTVLIALTDVQANIVIVEVDN